MEKAKGVDLGGTNKTHCEINEIPRFAAARYGVPWFALFIEAS
jgi:hypothetical protein